MLQLDGLVGIIALGFWIYCLFDVITAPAADIRNLPKAAWLLIVLLLSAIGGILWLVAGRPPSVRAGGPSYRRGGGAATGRPPGPDRGPRSVAPDDDPDFLAQLKKANSEHESMLGEWEADLRRREEELRKRPDGDGSPER